MWKVDMPNIVVITLHRPPTAALRDTKQNFLAQRLHDGIFDLLCDC